MLESIFQTVFTQKHVFAEPPPPQVRRLLLEAGYKFDGVCWARTVGTACSLSPAEAMHFIAQDCKDYRESGLTDGREKLA